MAFGTNSVGFGHGKFGHGCFGHGPWLTFPYTPGYVAADRTQFAVDVHQFEDFTEQRYLTSRERGVTLRYEFPVVDSATVAGITSWYLGTLGPYTRFKAVDHRDGRPYIVRFADDTLEMLRGPALKREIPPFGLKAVRHWFYPEEVRVDSPSGYWRLGETTGTTADDASGNAAIGGYNGASYSAGGALTGDYDTAGFFSGGGEVSMGAALFAFTGVQPFTCELWCQPDSYVATDQMLMQRALVDGFGAQGYAVAWANGSVVFRRHRDGVTDTAQSPVLPLQTYHHIVATYDGVGMRLYVNGTVVASVASALSLKSISTTFTLGSDFGFGSLYRGRLDEAAVYPSALSAPRVWLHYVAGVRP